MLSWLAALDRIHYLRWRLVFLNNMKLLLDSIKEEIDHRNFTVKKTSRVFSAMRIDQAHKQNNRAAKVDGGAIGTMDSAMLE